MCIGILGAGKIGAAAGRLVAAAGHEMIISNSRGPGSIATTVAEPSREAGALLAGS